MQFKLPSLQLSFVFWQTPSPHLSKQTVNVAAPIPCISIFGFCNLIFGVCSGVLLISELISCSSVIFFSGLLFTRYLYAKKTAAAIKIKNIINVINIFLSIFVNIALKNYLFIM